MCSRYPGHLALQLEAAWPNFGEAAADDDGDRNRRSAAAGNYLRHSRRRRNNDCQIDRRWNSSKTWIGGTTQDLTGRRMYRYDLAGEARLNRRQIAQEQCPSLACGGRSSGDRHPARGEQGVSPISHGIPSTAAVNRPGAHQYAEPRGLAYGQDVG